MVIGKSGKFPVASAAYWVVASVVLGSCAWLSTHDIASQDVNKDIWQHLAALRALMADPINPASPFIADPSGSRHFHPLWLFWAVVARSFDLHLMQVLALAAYVAMALLAGAIYAFARVYFTQAAAPLVLLLALVFGWLVPVGHTGFISAATLAYAAPYPATYLVAFSLGLWALTICALRDWRWLLALAPLAALMMTVHQLGAVIGLIGAGWLVLCWPDCRRALRIWAALALLLGVLVAQLWPYFTPLALILARGNSTWQGGPAFFSPLYIAVVGVPAVFGILGLRERKALALRLACMTYLAIFALGYAGVQIAGRFLMPATLVMQIGLASYLLSQTGLRAKSLAVLCGAGWAFLVLMTYHTRPWAEGEYTVPPYLAAGQLLADVPPEAVIAAHDLAAWVVVGQGYRVVSVPWPEPLITDLDARQALTAALFDPALTAAARGALAQQAGTSVLLADARLLAPRALAVLRAQAAAVQVVGDLYRFDLPRADQATP